MDREEAISSCTSSSANEKFSSEVAWSSFGRDAWVMLLHFKGSKQLFPVSRLVLSALDLVILGWNHFLQLWGQWGRKILRATGNGKHQGNCVFQMQQNWCTYELTETVAEYTELTQARARWGASTERGKWAWSPTPKQKAISNWQPHRRKGKVSFLSGGKSLSGSTNLTEGQGWPVIGGKLRTNSVDFGEFFFVSLWAVFTFLFFCLYYGFRLCVFFVRVREHTLCSFSPLACLFAFILFSLFLICLLVL